MRLLFDSVDSVKQTVLSDLLETSIEQKLG